MKKLCSGDDCFREVDDEGFTHPFASLCYRCITPEQQKTFKNWRKHKRAQANKKARQGSDN